MARWLVQLSGERTDLEEYPRWFPEGDVFAIEDSGAFFLVGPALESDQTSEGVLIRATVTLDRFTGVISLLWNGRTRSKIAALEALMRIDLYTKFILTVIALCLIWLSIRGPEILPGAFAQQTSFGERVVITGWEDEQGQVRRFSRPKDISGRPLDKGGVPVAIVYGAR